MCIRDSITFTEAGTYTYLIEEAVPARPVAGMTYDKTVYQLTITVTQSGGGGKTSLEIGAVTLKQAEKVESGIDWENARDAKAVVFENSNAAPSGVLYGSAAFKVSKDYAEGEGLEDYDGQVKFTITGIGTGADSQTIEAPLPNPAEVSISGEGSASFGDITFTQAGEYVYTIQETDPNVTGMEYDRAVYTVTVNVTLADDNKTLHVGAPTYQTSDGAYDLSLIHI